MHIRILFTTALLAFGLMQARAQSVAFDWAVSMGGTGIELGRSIDTDLDGNIYVTGYFMDTVDFDPGPGMITHISHGNLDIFVQKLDSSGNCLWAKTFGGSGMDLGYAIAVDESGDVFVVGGFETTIDIQSDSLVTSLISSGKSDIILLKLDGSGNLLWTNTIGGANSEWGESLAIDVSGNVYISGYFCDTIDFDPGPALVPLISEGNSDIYIVKFNEAGDFLWAKSAGGGATDAVSSIAIDAFGNILITGWFVGVSDFDPGPGIVSLTSQGSADVFVCKLDSAGELMWAKSVGGTMEDLGYSIAVDAAGDVFITGYFEGQADFFPGPVSIFFTSNGDFDVFVLKLDATGEFRWIKSIGGIDSDIGISITIDSSGNSYITGIFSDLIDIDPGPDTDMHVSQGDDDIFIIKLDSLGNFRWGQTIGGVGSDGGGTLATNALADVYVSGYFQDGVDFDPSQGVNTLTANGSFDIFVLKLSQGGPFSTLKNDFGPALNAYPNPTTGRMTVELGKSYRDIQIAIRNLHGQLLQSTKIESASRFELEIEGPQGIYLIEIRTREGKAAVLTVAKQ